MDAHMIAAMRLILAALALLITYIDPSEPSYYVAATYTTLALYVVYSMTLFVCTWRRCPLVLTRAHWIDVGWYIILIGLSNGTNSIFFSLFFFAMLVASFRWGFGAGLRITVVSAVLFSVVGFVMSPPEPNFELNRLLLRPTMMLVLGYMMAYWGGFEITLKRRLALLKDISTFSNPRFGVDRTLGALLEQLRAFYDADTCLLVMADSGAGGHSVRRVDRRDPEAAVRAEPISERLAHLLLELPATQAAVSCHAPRLWAWWRQEASVRAYDRRFSRCEIDSHSSPSAPTFFKECGHFL
jgi:hypothetical protein